MGNTTDKPCKVCGQAADSSSRECVQCKVPVCKTHKHMCMTKLQQHKWKWYVFFFLDMCTIPILLTNNRFFIQ